MCLGVGSDGADAESGVAVESGHGGKSVTGSCAAFPTLELFPDWRQSSRNPVNAWLGLPQRRTALLKNS